MKKENDVKRIRQHNPRTSTEKNQTPEKEMKK